MYSFSVDYTCKYELSFAPNYKWSTCGKCYNAKTGRLIKQVMKGGSIGYIINGKFHTVTYLRKNLQIIKKKYCPFLKTK